MSSETIIPAAPGYFVVVRLPQREGHNWTSRDPVIAWRIKPSASPGAPPVVVLPITFSAWCNWHIADDIDWGVLRPDGMVDFPSGESLVLVQFEGYEDNRLKREEEQRQGQAQARKRSPAPARRRRAAAKPEAATP